MKNRYLAITILIIAVLCGGIYYSVAKNVRDSDSIKDLDLFKKVLPGVTRVTKDPSKPLYIAYAKDKKIGMAFFTAETTPDIQGYVGPINILVGVDLKGTILGLKVISHAETSSFVRDLDVFVKQFVSRGPSAFLEIGKDIDGITGATITSQAITRSIKESLDLLFKVQAVESRVDTSRIKEQIEKAGLTVTEARYWKEVN